MSEKFTRKEKNDKLKVLIDKHFYLIQYAANRYALPGRCDYEDIVSLSYISISDSMDQWPGSVDTEEYAAFMYRALINDLTDIVRFNRAGIRDVKKEVSYVEFMTSEGSTPAESAENSDLKIPDGFISRIEETDSTIEVNELINNITAELTEFENTIFKLLISPPEDLTLLWDDIMTNGYMYQGTLIPTKRRQYPWAIPIYVLADYLKRNADDISAAVWKIRDRATKYIKACDDCAFLLA